MSDVMLLGVLRLPRECWSADPIFVMQQHGRCMEAADRIEADAETIETLQAEVAAERARRIKAEEVIDAVIKGTGPWGSVYSLAEEYRAQYPRVEKAPIKEYDPGPGCHAGQDGECGWSQCPQLRDGEPVKSGRHCPLDTGDDDEG